jgi:glycosyltransferase involved in cell wall biosynthesis
VISFVVPAHDEQTLLSRTLEAIRESATGLDDAHELVVVDDDSADATSVVARRAGARVVAVNVRQISASRNAGARATCGDILMFVDADTAVTPEVVHAALRAIRGGAVGGGCAVQFDGRLPLWARILQPLARWTYRTRGLAAGCFLFCSRRAFVETGGFDETIFAGEEAVMSGRLKRIGRFVVLHERVVTSARKLRAYSGLEIARSMCLLAVLGRRGVSDRRHLDLWYGPRRADPDGDGWDGMPAGRTSRNGADQQDN